MMQWFTNNPVKTILLAGIFIFLLHLNVLPVTIMEARNFITAREMVLDGNWFLTTMNGLPRYEKPPLPTWFTAVSGEIMGISNLYALRLPTALMAIFTGLMVFKFSLKLSIDRQQSLVNGLILVTSFYIIAITNEAPWDIYAHGFMLTAIYFFYSLFKDEKRIWRNTFMAALFTGLSFLSKGPVSLYALLLPFLLAYGFSYGYRGFKNKRFAIWVYVLISIILSLSWYWYVRMADPDSFLEIAKKETGNWSSYNIRPFYYYWSFFVQSGVWTVLAFVALFYPVFRKKVIHPKAYLFTFLWTILSVILLSLIPEKKTRYLSPVLIPLAMNTGFYLVYVIRNFESIKTTAEKIPAYFHFGLIALIGFSFPVAGYIFLNKLPSPSWFWFVLTSITLVIISIAIVYFLYKKALNKVFMLNIFFIMSITSFGLPIAKSLKTNTAYLNINSLMAEKPLGLPVYSFGELAPEMLWHYGDIIQDVENDKVSEIIEDLELFGVLVNSKEKERFERIFDEEFNMSLKHTYDLNYGASPGNKRHKSRLVSYYYLLEHK
jgi:4-amino-4-deoxy-L-arabinose transferase-like glycosyltransferase